MTGFHSIFTVQMALLNLPHLIACSRSRVGWHGELQGPSLVHPWASVLPRPTLVAHTLGSSLGQMQGTGWRCLCLGISPAQSAVSWPPDQVAV